MANSKSSAGTYKFSYEELSGICSQIAMILRSGIMIGDGLEAMCAVRDRGSQSQKVLLGMAEDVQARIRFHEAAEKTGAFPRYMTAMAELGESTGKLEEVMTALSVHYKREARLRGMVFGAVFYPAVLCVMISIVIAVLVTRILPVFSRVLEDMGAEPPPLVQTLINVGVYGARYAMFALLAVFALSGALFAYSKLSGKSGAAGVLLSAIPAVRRIYEKMAAGQFASAMALTLSSGINVDEAFGMIKNIVTGKRAAGKVDAVAAAVAEGKSFSYAVIEARIFDVMTERMILVGERAGSVDEVMREVAVTYEEGTTVALSNLVSVIEPVMVAFLALVTGVILLAIMMPLIGIISVMGW